MVVSPGGEHFVGGYRDDSALVMRIDPNGGVVWVKTFRSGSPYRDLVNQLSITPDGYLIGTADSYGGSPITYRSIICFKFDTEGNPQWIRYSSSSQPFFSLATLPRSTSEYVLVDAPFDQSNDPFTDPMSHGISATDGSITWTALVSCTNQVLHTWTTPMPPPWAMGTPITPPGAITSTGRTDRACAPSSAHSPATVHTSGHGTIW